MLWESNLRRMIDYGPATPIHFILILVLLILSASSSPTLGYQLYPCNEASFNTTFLAAAGQFYSCLQRASSSGSMSPPTECASAGISPSSACACLACTKEFAKLMALYASYIREGTCGEQLQYNGVASKAISILSSYPCFLRALDINDPPASLCPDPNALLCGTDSKVLSAAGMPKTSQHAHKTCGLALKAVCAPGTAPSRSAQSEPPFCGPWCDSHTGVCSTLSNGTELTSFQTGAYEDGIPISLFDLMCSPTGAYAQAVVSAFPGTSASSYSVNLTAKTTYKQLLPFYSGYYSPPVTLPGNPGMYDISQCLPGVYCFSSGVYVCPGGYYCPDPFLTTRRCPENTFCPRGTVTPFSCGFLDDCGADDGTRTQYIGALVAGIVLGVGIILFGIIKLIEVLRRQKWMRQSALRRVTSINRVSEDEGVEILMPPVSPIDIAFSNLTVRVPNSTGKEREILHNASGTIPSGCITAILGGSGAGKTTLIDAVLGRVPVESEGMININSSGILLRSYPAGTLGYVPQQDVLLHTLTVREVLEHSAWVRLPSTWSMDQRRQQVDAVIAALGLSGCERSIIGNESSGKRGISGGQRKRVSIGIELVANPSVLVLDEPTTGLDATSALELMKCLQRIARSGRTVVTIIHQPRYEIFELLDRIFLLSRGSIVFEGVPRQAIQHFQSLGFTPPEYGNPAEFLLDTLSRESTVDDLISAWHDRRDAFAMDGPDPFSVSHSSASLPASGGAWIVIQTVAATYRQWLQRYRSPWGVVIFIVVHMFVGAVLGGGFLQSHGIFVPPVPSSIAELCPPSVASFCRTEPIDWMSLRLSAFFLSVALGSAALVAAVFTFGSELDVLNREINAGSSLLALFIGKNIAEVPFILAGPLFFSAIYVPMLRPDSDWILQYWIFVGVEVASYGLGYFLSMLLALGNAHVVGVVSIFAFSVCSGIAPKLRVVKETLGPLRVLWDISFPRYAVEASVACEAEYYLIPGQAFDESTRVFAQEYGFQLGNSAYWWDFGMMVVIGFGFRALACLLLWYHTRQKGSISNFICRKLRWKSSVAFWSTILVAIGFLSTPAEAMYK